MSDADSALGHVRRLWPLWALNDIELNLQAFQECLESVHLNRREVAEHIAPPVTLDETVPFGVVEPPPFQ